MNLIPRRTNDRTWSPFRDLERLQKEFDRLFDGTALRPFDGAWTREGGWTPALEVIDGKDKVRILAEIPGLRKEDLELSVEGGVLTLRGEKKEEARTEDDGVIRSERIYGAFQRALQLPDSVDADRIQAAYRDGVLEITLPKKENAKPKLINVKVQ